MISTEKCSLTNSIQHLNLMRLKSGYNSKSFLIQKSQMFVSTILYEFSINWAKGQTKKNPKLLSTVHDLEKNDRF